MKFTNRKRLVTGLLAGTFMFIGCTASTPTVRKSPYGNNTNAGAGHISKTKASDDNLRMPLEDPLRTKEHESIRDAEVEPAASESEQPGVGTGGSGNTSPSSPPQEYRCPLE
ncbi:hypothetical protein [Hyalangium versicolor]|uniref:hypothetical protein n=1 Tax=Hyalangium versicolor TaxID=2861190 RepID=UPI001CC92246|nr:hypothetical protein [Hyalangium versicolor]